MGDDIIAQKDQDFLKELYKIARTHLEILRLSEPPADAPAPAPAPADAPADAPAPAPAPAVSVEKAMTDETKKMLKENHERLMKILRLFGIEDIKQGNKGILGLVDSVSKHTLILKKIIEMLDSRKIVDDGIKKQIEELRTLLETLTKKVDKLKASETTTLERIQTAFKTPFFKSPIKGKEITIKNHTFVITTKYTTLSEYTSHLQSFIKGDFKIEIDGVTRDDKLEIVSMEPKMMHDNYSEIMTDIFEQGYIDFKNKSPSEYVFEMMKRLSKMVPVDTPKKEDADSKKYKSDYETYLRLVNEECLFKMNKLFQDESTMEGHTRVFVLPVSYIKRAIPTQKEHDSFYTKYISNFSNQILRIIPDTSVTIQINDENIGKKDIDPKEASSLEKGIYMLVSSSVKILTGNDVHSNKLSYLRYLFAEGEIQEIPKFIFTKNLRNRENMFIENLKNMKNNINETYKDILEESKFVPLGSNKATIMARSVDFIYIHNGKRATGYKEFIEGLLVNMEVIYEFVKNIEKLPTEFFVNNLKETFISSEKDIVYVLSDIKTFNDKRKKSLVNKRVIKNGIKLAEIIYKLYQTFESLVSYVKYKIQRDSFLTQEESKKLGVLLKTLRENVTDYDNESKIKELLKDKKEDIKLPMMIMPYVYTRGPGAKYLKVR